MYSNKERWFHTIFWVLIVCMVTSIFTGVYAESLGIKECARGHAGYVPQYTITNGDTTKIDTVIVFYKK